MDEILAYPGLSGLRRDGGHAFRRLAVAIRATGRSATDFTVAQFAAIGGVSASYAAERVKILLQAGVVRQVTPYFPGSPTRRPVAARYAVNSSFFSETRFHSGEHHHATEYLSVHPITEVPAPPKVQKRRSAPAACREGGERPPVRSQVTEEIQAIAGRIKALAGDDLDFRPQALMGMLHKQRPTLADLDTALEDVTVVLPVRRRTRPDAREWLMVVGYLGNEAMRIGVADQAQRIREEAQRQTTVVAQPAGDAATRLAAEFGITSPNFGAKILSEALADPAKAAELVKLGLAQNARSANPIRLPEIYAFRALTMQDKWAEIRDCAEAQKLLAGRSEALGKVIRAGWIRCAAHDVPAAILPHLEAWAVLQVTMPPPDAAGHLAAHQAERQAHAMLLAAAVEALGSQAAVLSEVLRQRLAASGMTEGSVVWPRALRAAWAKVVAEEVPWMPLQVQGTEQAAA